MSLISSSLNSLADFIVNLYSAFKTVSMLQRAQVFVFLVPIYKLTYHYFHDPFYSKQNADKYNQFGYQEFYSYNNSYNQERMGYIDNTEIFGYLRNAFLSLLIFNLIHIIRYSKSKTKYFNTLIGTSAYNYRACLGDINLLSGTLIVPLVLTVKFLYYEYSQASGYWLQLLTLSLINSFLLLTNVTLNSLKLNFIKKLSYWSLIIIGFATSIQYYSNKSNMLICLTYLIVNQILLYSTINGFEKNFSLSEASVLSQFISGLGFDFFQSYFNESNYNFEPTSYVILIRAGLVFASIGVYSAVIIKKYLKSQYSGIIGIFLGILLPWYYLIYPSITYQLGQNPFNWLINYIWESKSIQLTIGFWIATIMFSIIYINTQTNLNSLNSKRKFFHYLSCLMFIPIYSYNIDFLNIALMVGIGFMLIIEIYRINQLPGYATLNKFINSFRDSKDIGEFMWAHVYLLLGCSITIWLGQLGGLSGVVSLGLCDSTASIIGKSVGKTKWFNSKKSFEGSLVFMILCTTGLIYASLEEFSELGSLVAKASFYTAILEAVTVENDNLIIPLYLWVILNLPN